MCAPPAERIAPVPGDGARSHRLVRAAENPWVCYCRCPASSVSRTPPVLAVVAGVTAASGGSTGRSPVRIAVILPVKKLCVARLTRW